MTDILDTDADEITQLRADLMGQRDAYGLLLIRCEQAEADLATAEAEWHRQVRELQMGRDNLEAALLQRHETAQRVVAEQAEDEGLWCLAVHIMEADLQAALRRLHAALGGGPCLTTSS